MANRRRKLKDRFAPPELALIREKAYWQHRRDGGCAEVGRSCGRCKNLFRRWQREKIVAHAYAATHPEED